MKHPVEQSRVGSDDSAGFRDRLRDTIPTVRQRLPAKRVARRAFARTQGDRRGSLTRYLSHTVTLRFQTAPLMPARTCGAVCRSRSQLAEKTMVRLWQVGVWTLPTFQVHQIVQTDQPNTSPSLYFQLAFVDDLRCLVHSPILHFCRPAPCSIVHAENRSHHSMGFCTGSLPPPDTSSLTGRCWLVPRTICTRRHRLLRSLGRACRLPPLEHCGVVVLIAK
jgi:hypothetical protein